MRCVACGAAELVQDGRGLPYTYKGVATTLAPVGGLFCPSCGEVVLGPAEAERVSDQVLRFNKQVNAAQVDPGFIVRVRKKLKLGQREAAEIFGGGVNAFSRYENGKTEPPMALVKLLRVLDRHPHLLDEVRTS